MSNNVYAGRRQRLMEHLGQGVTLVRGAGPEGVNPNFLYLTGLGEPSAALLLAPEGVRVGTGRANPGPDYVRGRIVHQILFLPPADPLASRWGEDSTATLESVGGSDAGFDALCSTADLNAVLTTCLPVASRVHLVRARAPSLDAATDADSTFADRLRSRFIGLEVHDGTPLAHEMRRLKDRTEIEAVQRSIGVTAEALNALVAALGNDVREHTLEAEIARVYRSHGGTHAFDPIVAAGPNALKLHYGENDGPVESGQLLLVDTGVSIAGYKSDITRTLPVDGRFTPRQREVYDVVLRSQREAIAMCRPGIGLGDIHARAFEVIAENGFGDYLPHGIGHHIGLETHDVGDVHRPLEPGAIVTVEPGIYIAEESIGIRIEDDVLVTPDGPEILSEAIPVEAEAVEAWVSDGRRG